MIKEKKSRSANLTKKKWCKGLKCQTKSQKKNRSKAGGAHDYSVQG